MKTVTASVNLSAATAPAPNAAILDIAARNSFDTLFIEGVAAPVGRIVVLMAQDTAPAVRAWQALEAWSELDGQGVLVVKDRDGLKILPKDYDGDAGPLAPTVLAAVNDAHRCLQPAA